MTSSGYRTASPTSKPRFAGCRTILINSANSYSASKATRAERTGSAERSGSSPWVRSDVADRRNQEDISDYHDDYDEPQWDPFERPDKKPHFDDEHDDPAKKPAPNPWWSAPQQGQKWGEAPPGATDYRTGPGTGKPYRGNTDKRTPFDASERWKDIADKYRDIRHPSKSMKRKIDQEMKDRGLTWSQRKKVYDHNGWH
jgi:hypothetical protein